MIIVKYAYNVTDLASEVSKTKDILQFHTSYYLKLNKSACFSIYSYINGPLLQKFKSELKQAINFRLQLLDI